MTHRELASLGASKDRGVSKTGPRALCGPSGTRPRPWPPVRALQSIWEPARGGLRPGRDPSSSKYIFGEHHGGVAPGGTPPSCRIYISSSGRPRLPGDGDGAGCPRMPPDAPGCPALCGPAGACPPQLVSLGVSKTAPVNWRVWVCRKPCPRPRAPQLVSFGLGAKVPRRPRHATPSPPPAPPISPPATGRRPRGPRGPRRRPAGLAGRLPTAPPAAAA